VTVLSFDVAREMAARGAVLLDDKSPGWWRTLVPESIDVEYPDRCVLGSLDPEVGYLAMLYQLDLDPRDHDKLTSHGFDLADEEDDSSAADIRESYARLTDAWRNLIAGRQIEAGLR
jgi:hypothetical protein